MSQVRRRRGRRYWLRILLANFVGALACGRDQWRAGAGDPRRRARALVRRRDDLANVIGTLAAVAMPRVAGRCWETPTRSGQLGDRS